MRILNHCLKKRSTLLPFIFAVVHELVQTTWCLLTTETFLLKKVFFSEVVTRRLFLTTNRFTRPRATKKNRATIKRNICCLMIKGHNKIALKLTLKFWNGNIFFPLYLMITQIKKYYCSWQSKLIFKLQVIVKDTLTPPGLGLFRHIEVRPFIALAIHNMPNIRPIKLKFALVYFDLSLVQNFPLVSLGLILDFLIRRLKVFKKNHI